MSALTGSSALPGYAVQGDAETAARLRAEITELIGDARCNNLVNCRVVGLGAAPCGGPEEYVAYSIWKTVGDEIGTLVSEYNLIREDIALDSEAVGRCEQLLKPAVDCIRSRCVVVPDTR